jgi:uncharacterized protein YcbK (DUF882 family)
MKKTFMVTLILCLSLGVLAQTKSLKNKVSLLPNKTVLNLDEYQEVISMNQRTLISNLNYTQKRELLLERLEKMESTLETSFLDKLYLNYDLNEMKKLTQQYRFGALKEYMNNLLIRLKKVSTLSQL